MKKCLLIFTILLTLATRNANANQEFQEALATCYFQYANQREIENASSSALKFRKKIKEIASSIPAIPPENPMNLGIDVDEGLNEMMHSYKILNSIIMDDGLMAKDLNMIAHLQCLYDIWIVEREGDVLSQAHAHGAYKLFLHNIQKYAPNYNFQEKIVTQDTIDNNYCYAIFFNKGKYIPNPESRAIIEKIINQSGYVEYYNIVITGYIDWRDEPHYGKILTKKRMIFIRDLLYNNGIPNIKIRGVLEELNRESVLKTTAEEARKAKVCIVNTKMLGFTGKTFIQKFDYTQKGEKIQLIRKK